MTNGYTSSDHLSRRSFLRGAAALGATGGLGLLPARAAVDGRRRATSERRDGRTASDQTTLTYWDWFGGAGGAYMTKMVDAFNQSQKAVKVDATVYTLPDYWTKLSTSTSVNKGPNVAALKVSELQEFAQHGLLTPIETSRLAKHGLTKADFPATSWNGCHYNGTLYAVPLDTEGWVLYYNTDMCRKAGLLASNGQLKPTSSQQGFINTLKAGQAAGAQYAIALDYTASWDLWYLLYSQLKGELVSKDGKKVLLNDKKGLEAGKLLQEIGAGQNLGTTNTTDIGTLFAEQKAAFMISFAASYVDFIKTRNTPFDVTYVPKIFDRQVTFGDTSVFVIPRHRNQSQGDVDSALAFFAGALKHAIYWAQGAHIPDYLPVRKTKAFKSLLPQAHYSNVANYVEYLPSVSYTDELNTDAGAIWSAVYTGHMTPQAGYQQFRSQLQKLATQS